MIRTVDARGLACPQPVIRTRNAMAQATQVITLVDNETSVTNVSRMAQKAGWQVEILQEDGGFRLEMIQGESATATPQILVRGFFHTLGEVEPLPQTIIFFNTGVELACQGSPVLDDVRALEAEGIEILVCGTCLNYFELTGELAAGQVSNMYDIAETMLRAGKVVTL